MRWVTEYLRCEQACRDLAGKMTKPDDKRALELMASAWAKRAAERKRAIDSRSPQKRVHTASAAAAQQMSDNEYRNPQLGRLRPPLRRPYHVSL